MIELTQEEIAKHYAACMASVNLINAGKTDQKMTDEEWADTVARNKEHLKIQLGKDMFDGYDVTPLQQAAGE